MKHYIGNKRVKAREMNRGAYNAYRGWDLPDNELGSDEGYLVEYVDGGQSNHPKHDFYISWSPREVFEKAYKISETPLDRLIIEDENLAEKLNALNTALNKDGFDKVVGDYQFDLLTAQRSVMASYRTILRLIIKDLKIKN